MGASGWTKSGSSRSRGCKQWCHLEQQFATFFSVFSDNDCPIPRQHCLVEAGPSTRRLSVALHEQRVINFIVTLIISGGKKIGCGSSWGAAGTSGTSFSRGGKNGTYESRQERQKGMDKAKICRSNLQKVSATLACATPKRSALSFCLRTVVWSRRKPFC
jgi:hypothetical protein